MIELTEKAAIKIKEIADAEGIEACTVRIRIIGGGCAGFTHDMFYETVISDLDEITEFNDFYGHIKVVIDPLSYQYLDEVTIDYLDGPMGGGFKFLNPKATGSCGCGSSVSF